MPFCSRCRLLFAFCRVYSASEGEVEERNGERVECYEDFFLKQQRWIFGQGVYGRAGRIFGIE